MSIKKAMYECTPLCDDVIGVIEGYRHDDYKRMMDLCHDRLLRIRQRGCMFFETSFPLVYLEWKTEDDDEFVPLIPPSLVRSDAREK